MLVSFFVKWSNYHWHLTPPLKIKTLFVVLNYETGFLKLTQHELHFNYLDSGKVDFLPDHLNYVQYHY